MEIRKENNEIMLNTNYAQEIFEKVNENKYYYIPICTEKGCEGNLKINILEENFIINCICEKNHIFNDVLFETFEKYYLEEKIIQNCFKCNQIYCSSCYLLDIHIKNNLKNLRINKLDRNKIELNEIPTKNEINSLKEKKKKKTFIFNDLIKSLNKWQKEFNKKIERIKINLINEINILKKLFFNYNKDYMNHNYYSNFHSINKHIDILNNKYLKEFMEHETFKEKSKCIFDLLFFKESKPLETRLLQKKLMDIGKDSYLKVLNKDILFLYSDLKIKLLTFDKNKLNFEIINEIKLKEKLNSFFISSDNKKIYATLDEKKSVIIINYNQINNSLEISDEKIKIKSKGHFNKCFILNNNYLITVDDFSIYLWNKNNLNSKYINIKKYNFKYVIYDSIVYDENFILLSQYNKLKFYSINNQKIEKIIENIECNELPNSLILINNYILVNCKKGIVIILIKTKEIIQYIENLINCELKEILGIIEDNIYLMNAIGDLYKYKFIEKNLKLIEKSGIRREDINLEKETYSF